MYVVHVPSRSMNGNGVTISQLGLNLLSYRNDSKSMAEYSDDPAEEWGIVTRRQDGSVTQTCLNRDRDDR